MMKHGKLFMLSPNDAFHVRKDVLMLISGGGILFCCQFGLPHKPEI